MKPTSYRWRQENNQEAVTYHSARVILAEDDDELRVLLAQALRRDGYDVIEAKDGRELLDLIVDQMLYPGSNPPPDLVITDVRMPGPSGLRALAALRRLDWVTPMMVITAFGDDTIKAECQRIGVSWVFDKPFDIDDLRTAVRNLVDPISAGQ